MENEESEVIPDWELRTSDDNAEEGGNVGCLKP